MTDGERISSSELLRRYEAGERNFQRVILQETNLQGANLWGIILWEANLWGTDLRNANLQKADLRGAILEKADLRGANFSDVNLTDARLIEANLSSSNFTRANLCGVRLVRANLQSADFSGAKLSKAELIQSNLIGTKFLGTELSEAGLTAVTAIAADFEKAILTGACLEDWHITDRTNLDGVTCEYVYLRNQQEERRPHTGNFAPGEFTKLFQLSLETVDLIFREGVNWKAAAYSFNNTQVLNKDTPLAIQTIENKGDGTVVIRVQAPPNTDKEKIHSDFWQGYEFGQKAIESQYQARLEDKDKEINRLFLLLNQFSKVPKLMADSKKQYNFYREVGSVENQGHIVGSGSNNTINNAVGEVKGNYNIHNYAPEKQTLAEAAAEIQKLLKQLEQTNPTATEAQQIEHINDETTPKFKRRVVGALQATGEAAIDEFILENKYLKVAKSAIKGWLKPE